MSVIVLVDVSCSAVQGLWRAPEPSSAAPTTAAADSIASSTIEPTLPSESVEPGCTESGDSSSAPGDSGVLGAVAQEESKADGGETAATNDESEGDGETESREAPLGASDTVPRYSADLSDAELADRFVHGLSELGSMSVGFADEGRVINGVQLPRGDGWDVLVPEYAWGTQETIDSIEAAGNAVTARFGEAARLRVVHIGKKDGGYLRPHHSHQSGRDVDLGLYSRADAGSGDTRKRWLRAVDPALNWALVRAVITLTDVQMILVDHAIQGVLYDYALSQGEDKAWLDSIFHGPQAMVLHARGHRDHFHVRFYSPRSQEMGRRVVPFLARRPDENLAIYRVRSGDTLGAIARRYNSSVATIEKANGMHSSFLKVSRTLVVPLRGPCTRCPSPPPVVVPARRAPPAAQVVSAASLTAPASSASDR